ncbi:MAG: hypothetical protein NC340_07895 [Ruminococcus flavefaciens]|nr:hypothetical protein [Ruminococcus flavefaciens]MCM1228665.1 hypothetical protein [Ruminococcus flavefaciens]
MDIHENEEWILYNPLNLPRCQALSVEIKQEENTVFAVDCENCSVRLVFECFVPVYLYSYEGIRMATYAPVQEKYNDKYYFTKWFLYEIKNSGFFNWAMTECGGLYHNCNRHFCIVTENDVVDILASGEPDFIITPK